MFPSQTHPKIIPPTPPSPSTYPPPPPTNPIPISSHPPPNPPPGPASPPSPPRPPSLTSKPPATFVTSVAVTQFGLDRSPPRVTPLPSLPQTAELNNHIENANISCLPSSLWRQRRWQRTRKPPPTSGRSHSRRRRPRPGRCFHDSSGHGHQLGEDVISSDSQDVGWMLHRPVQHRHVTDGKLHVRLSGQFGSDIATFDPSEVTPKTGMIVLKMPARGDQGALSVPARRA